MDVSILLLKFFAAILITNSHYDSMYPGALKLLATGGSLGNAMFFMVSGYLLIHSKAPSFAKWYEKRVVRLYPSIWLVTLALMLLEKKSYGAVEYITKFIYPTRFWFVSAILVFYILYYFIAKWGSKNILLILLAATWVPYFFIYLNYLDTSRWVIESGSVFGGYFRWIFGFQMMLLGGYIRKSREEMKFNVKFDFVLLAASFLFYFILKYLVVKVPLMMRLQFVCQLFTFPVIYYSYKFANAEGFKKVLTGQGIVAKTVVWISGLTLEVYLVQKVIIDHLKTIVFPINIAVITILILAAAYGVKFVTDKFSHWAFNNKEKTVNKPA